MNANKGVPAGGTGRATKKAPDAYAMGNSEAETGRLVRQAGVYAPFTRRMLEQAGLGPGARVLDVGTGAGDVSPMAAGIVGASGSVVGVDLNLGILETAGARALREGLINTTFVEGDVGEPMEMDGGFDAAVGHLVFTHQPDPAETLRSMAAKVCDGGMDAIPSFMGAWATKLAGGGA